MDQIVGELHCCLSMSDIQSRTPYTLLPLHSKVISDEHSVAAAKDTNIAWPAHLW